MPSIQFRLAMIACCLLVAPLISIAPVRAQTAPIPDKQEKPFLHALFSDDAVLQRDRPIPIWGWTGPGQKVTVKLDAKTSSAKADASGRWMVRIGPYPAGGPHTLTVIGSTPAESATRQNILFGDVWLCSGQSNMEMGIRGVDNSQQEIANANYPQIRLFTVPQRTAFTPQKDVDGQWLVCTPENILKNSQGGVQGGNLGFSAVGYFFGRKLHQELGVPIGLIQSAWGGTIIESWISESALAKLPDFQAQLAARKDFNAGTNFPIEKRVDEWLKQTDPAYDTAWSTSVAKDPKWKPVAIPGVWDDPATPDLTNFDGFGLFRREVMVPDAWAGHDLTITLGAIDDADTSYWNGTIIGSTGGDTVQRKYTIPGALVKAGRNCLGVRVLDGYSRGGMWGPADAMRLSLDANHDLPLAGQWDYRVSLPATMLPMMPVVEKPGDPNRIDVLYNGMIAPLEPFGLKGAIWYQGESNSGRSEQYGRLLPALIGDWRGNFDTPLPFHVVQLAGYYAPDDQPRDKTIGERNGEDWPALRAAQQHTVDIVPRTSLAVITDVGDARDIHPRNKQDVGLRLALGALAKDYGKKVEFTGPVFKTAILKGTQIELTFEHVDGGLSFKGDAAHVFAVAGADRAWSWATPQIDGSKVTLSCPSVTKPAFVRYAWSNYPRGNLYNGDQLPAPPFQLDLTSHP